MRRGEHPWSTPNSFKPSRALCCPTRTRPTQNWQARLVCIDIQPGATTQAAERADILNVGGFSDAVFTMVSSFADGKAGADHWVGEIDRISLTPQ